MANKVILAGNVGQDPEIMTGGACRFTLATNESYTNKQGEKVDDVEWHNCVIFGKGAEIILKYVTKGSKLFVEGKIKTTMYEKNNEKRYSTSIIVNNFEFLDSKKESGSPQQSQTQTKATSGNMITEMAGNDDLPF